MVGNVHSDRSGNGGVWFCLGEPFRSNNDAAEALKGFLTQFGSGKV